MTWMIWGYPHDFGNNSEADVGMIDLALDVEKTLLFEVALINPYRHTNTEYIIYVCTVYTLVRIYPHCIQIPKTRQYN